MKIVDVNFSPAEAERLLTATHHDPFSFLGPHKLRDGRWVIRIFQPLAASITIPPDARLPVYAERVHAGGIFEVLLSGEARPAYLVETVFNDGTPTTLHPDP